MKSENETLTNVDTEAGLEAPMDNLVETSKEELQEVVDKLAEERAQSPFQVAAQSHAMMYHPFVGKLDNISGGAAKRILRYIVGYPFFVDELNPQDKLVESMAATADRLVQAKFTMILCQQLDQEKAKFEEFQKLEDSIEPVPADLPKAEETNTNNSQEGEK